MLKQTDICKKTNRERKQSQFPENLFHQNWYKKKETKPKKSPTTHTKRQIIQFLPHPCCPTVHNFPPKNSITCGQTGTPLTLCRTLSTLQFFSASLDVLSWLAREDTAECRAAPSFRCRQLLPTTIIGRLADCRTWQCKGRLSHSCQASVSFVFARPDVILLVDWV